MNSLLFVVAISQLSLVVDSSFPFISNGKPVKLDDHLQPMDIGRNSIYDEIKDDGKICARDCTLHPKSRICYYNFVAEQYHAMGPACKNCPYNQKDCFSPQCIIADGTERTVLSFNRMIPGPAIHVCYGDRIVVDVYNKMIVRELSIHWHGILQQRAQWMDGVPHVTQCAIPFGSHFRYDFHAETPGSHFYHSHLGFEMMEGLSGILNVRTEVDPLKEYYDYDLFSHTILLQDWMHFLMDTKYPGYNRNRTWITVQPDSYLINGMGNYVNPVTHSTTGTPFAEFKVRRNKRYRFRIIGATSIFCAYQFTIEGHSMTVIAADGYPFQPKTVRTLFMTGGERYDVVINTNQKPRAYWIRVQGYQGDCSPAFQKAILKYEETNDFIPPTLNSEALFNALPYPELNNVEKKCHNSDDNLCLDELKSLYKAPQKLFEEPYKRLFLNMLAHKFTVKELYLTNTYHRYYLPYSGPGVVPSYGGMFSDTINNKSNMFPSFPLLSDPRNPEIDKMICPEKCTFCECLNLIRIPLNSVVEFIFIDGMSDNTLKIEHPFHLHGNHYWVMKLGTKEDLKKPNYYRIDNTNEYPMMRDSIPVPPSGFAVLRFIADNPGFWLFHCHFLDHHVNGMVFVLQVGSASQLPKVPDHWPKCGDYLPPVHQEF